MVAGLESELLAAALTIGLGAVAGGITNAVAIWMLFHPYEPRGWRRFTVQGAIPKNRARLARTVARTVGQRLLAPEDLARQLGAPGVREAFERAVRSFVATLLEAERGPLRTELPPAVLAEVERGLTAITPVIADRLAEFTATPAFHSAVERILGRLAADVRDRPVGEVLTAARRAALRERLERLVSDVGASPELEQTIHGWFERQAERLASDRTPLLERLPPSLVGVVERGVAGYLPVALDRLAALLGNPNTRDRVEGALHELFQRFADDLLLHERIVAKLMVTEKTIARLLSTFQRDGVEHLARLLEEPAMRAEVARSVNDAVVSFLRQPLADHLASLGPERVSAITRSAAGGVVAALRDPGARAYLIDRLDQALAGAEHRTFGDLLEHLPPDRVAPWVAQAVEAAPLRGWVEEAAGAVMHALLDRPIGRVAGWLPGGQTDRIASALAPPLWEWVQRQVPVVVAQLDVETMVEQKVLGFSMQRLEELVRQTTQRELDLIVRLGYVLGAVVGATGYAIGRFVA